MIWYKRQKIKVVGMDRDGNIESERFFIKRTLFLGTEKLPIIAWDHPIKDLNK